LLCLDIRVIAPWLRAAISMIEAVFSMLFACKNIPDRMQSRWANLKWLD
jgi:hypothetical protein